MKIGLVDVDGHNFPNLPLMKLSAYHKQKGDYVEWAMPIAKPMYDRVYMSKVFTGTPDCQAPFDGAEIIKGGTGYKTSGNLPAEIENLCPDYSLYPKFSEAYGFLTRGCPRNCPFCIVTQKEGAVSKQVADLSCFVRKQKVIKLLDPNILACKDCESLLQQLINSKANIDYTQGLDARYVTDDIAKLICQTKISMVHFAFDLMGHEKAIVKGLKTFQRYFNKSDRHCQVYILTNYNTTHQEDIYRVKKVTELGYRPNIMIYDKGNHPQFLTDLARWSNNPILYNSCNFSDYIPRPAQGKSIKTLYGRKLAI
jgi:hypothetical protein